MYQNPTPLYFTVTVITGRFGSVTASYPDGHPKRFDTEVEARKWLNRFLLEIRHLNVVSEVEPHYT
jgi:hypothetical protein